MKALMLAVLLLAPGGDRERGLQAYHEGRFADAAAAFRAAIASEGDSPELQWNLALASWRAGDLIAAETAAEKYAAMQSGARVELHRGLLGNVRFDEARSLEAKADAAASQPPQPPAAAPNGLPPAAEPADPLPLLEQALGKVEQARDHFVAAAADAADAPSAEIVRNTERALRYADALQKRIDELKKQREQQKKDGDKSDQSKKDDQKKDDQKKDPSKDQQQPEDGKQDGKPDEHAKDQPGQGDDQAKEPQPKEPQPKEPSPQNPDESKAKPRETGKDAPDKDGKQPDAPEPKPGEDKPAGKEQQRADAPGETKEAKELSAEQTARLIEHLKELEKQGKLQKARLRSSRPPVERDW